MSSVGGEDKGYFACGAGDAGSNPAAGIYARVVQMAGRLNVPLSLIPRLIDFNFATPAEAG